VSESDLGQDPRIPNPKITDNTGYEVFFTLTSQFQQSAQKVFDFGYEKKISWQIIKIFLPFSIRWRSFALILYLAIHLPVGLPLSAGRLSHIFILSSK
jgi:hypothetical protein